MQQYGDLNDENLISLIREGDGAAQDYLLEKYKSLVKITARPYFIIGADRDDIIQEGMIGLYKAVRDFDPSKNVTFESFAGLCVTRQIITAIKSAGRKKHSPLNSSVSLNQNIDGEDYSFMEILPQSQSQSPEDLLINKETKNFIEIQIEKKLSEMESNVLRLFLLGKSYAEIAKIVKKDEKSIDNSLQRVRRKIANFIKTG
ncbi:MAG: RNA polymerase sporulation sigma factor SigH [Clostridiales bacterium]|jgi:RNA polymerase sporulation-specific sigma factor|nr:RNA polymerase sporulation sigma factor SigH [Clostridiales bacterium]